VFSIRLGSRYATGARVGALAAGLASLLIACRHGSVDSDCRKSEGAKTFSSDKEYSAYVVRQSCLGGEYVSYTVTIHATAHGDDPSWTKVVPLEADLRSNEFPVIVWTAPRKLVVRIYTRTISGSIVEHLGRDLIFERTYEASDPSRFPNFF
jgi:hypothetical protein